MNAATDSMKPLDIGVELRVHGTVQGVGFRPFVSRLAEDIGLTGDVRNTSDGVQIRLFGHPEKVDGFVYRLRKEQPNLARIVRLHRQAIIGRPPTSFHILESIESHPETAITADASMCADCRRELFDPTDRRYRYPFLNCTQCGPRYTIQQTIPYDRASTTMRGFPMCDDCLAEYGNPADRRFHAEANACRVCGPRLWLEFPDDPTIRHHGEDAISVALDRLKCGEIVAIKGLGGFHLACRGFDHEAIARLRQQKQRPRKPLALMVRDCAVAAAFVELSPVATSTLESVEAPIVLVPVKPNTPLSSAIAPGLDQVGVMLPYTPVHALLFEHLNEPLVMTSGNVRGNPQIIDNDDARRDLTGVADAFLMHNRPIASRADDSLVQIVGDQIQLLRRARGYAPRPVQLPSGFPLDHPEILAMGGDIKNAVAFAKYGSLTLSPFVGDLEQAKTFEDLRGLIDRTIDWLHSKPEIVAIDGHSSYGASKLGMDLAKRRRAAHLAVQHHHAHAAACMVEHGLPLDHPPIVAIILDGLGMGEGGALWGGEVLLAGYRSFERVASLRPAPLLGGDKAAYEPWRNLIAQLLVAFGPVEHWPAPFRRMLDGRPIDLLVDARRAGVNAPDCTSAGRLFDAVAAALDIAPERQDYEGEAAMLLQALASTRLRASDQLEGYPFAVSSNDDGFIHIDPAPLWRVFAENLAAAASPGDMAARFHLGLAEALTRVLSSIGRPMSSTVALSGGVCQNALLARLLREKLTDAGFDVLEARELPANDGGLAVGQAAIAIARSIL